MAHACRVLEIDGRLSASRCGIRLPGRPRRPRRSTATGYPCPVRIFDEAPLGPGCRPQLPFRRNSPIEPRNFNRSFDRWGLQFQLDGPDRCVANDQVPRITVHGTRKTCGSLLAALEVHPRVAMQILRNRKIAVTMESTPTYPWRSSASPLSSSGMCLMSEPSCCTFLLYQDKTAGSMVPNRQLDSAVYSSSISLSAT
jgi:hypothetical protein